MNIILDRFPKEKIAFFSDYFRYNSCLPRVVTIVGSETQQKSDDGCEIYGDFQIANGSAGRNNAWCLDAEIMEQLSHFEGLFLVVLSRFVLHPGSWTSQDMSDHYLKLSNFWVDCIDRNNIKACFSYYIPHDPSSLALYLVTKILKIPYIFIDIPHAARSIRFVSCSFSQRNLLLRSENSQTPEWASETISDYITNLRIDFSAAQPFFMEKVNDNFAKKKILSNRLKKFKRTVKKAMNKDMVSLVINFLLPKVPVFFKITSKKWSSEYNKKGSRIRWLYARICVKFRISRMSKRFHQLALSDQLALPNKYIYFPLPLEPEGSTIPTALIFKSVSIAIERLLSAMPSDYYLVLKVNPVQFQYDLAPYSTFVPWHSSDFYDELYGLDRVKLVSDKLNSGELISNALGVVCINGTAAIEAAALGKHSIIFSPMWYDSASFVHLCKTQDDIAGVIELMEKKADIEVNACDFKMSPSMIFDQKSFIDCDFEQSVLKSIATCFLSGLKEFERLDARKWEI